MVEIKGWFYLQVGKMGFGCVEGLLWFCVMFRWGGDGEEMG